MESWKKQGRNDIARHQAAVRDGRFYTAALRRPKNTGGRSRHL